MKSGLSFTAMAVLTAAVGLTGCETMAHNAFRLSESALATRSMQTREYSSLDDTAILSASMAVLQDMGYAVDEVETKLGLVSASKRADATNRLEAFSTLTADAVQCLVTLMLGCNRQHYNEIDDVQDIRLTLVSLPQFDREDTVAVRVTMQRMIWDKKGRLSKQETITDTEVYAAFFRKLSTAVFLEKAGL
jgi:hypothetical protein